MNKLPLSSRRAAMAAGLGGVALLATWMQAARREPARWFALPVGGAATFSGLAMGSTYSVKIAGPALSDAALAAAHDGVAQALGQVVQRMSHYDPESELSRLNRQPLGRALAVSEPTLQVLQVAEDVRKASEGAFDVAIGRAVDAWGFGPSGRPEDAPPAALPQGLLGLARDNALVMDVRAGTVTRNADVWANLSGIAKGWGVDRAADALDRLGLADYLVEVGGEVRARGRNAEGRPWQLAIEQPDALPQRALRILPLDGKALATSGDYRNFFMHQGRRYSHEIDPARAMPVTHALASVSVVADDCTQADAWSTALFVLGPQLGPDTARRLGLAAHFMQRRSDGSFDEVITPPFAALGSRRVG